MNAKLGSKTVVAGVVAAVLFSFTTAAHSVRSAQPGCGSSFPVSLKGHQERLEAVNVVSENMWARDNETRCMGAAQPAASFFVDHNAVGNAQWKVIGGAKPMARLEITASATREGRKICYAGQGMTGLLGEETVVELKEIGCGII